MRCEYFGRCGSCKFDGDYEEQKEYKINFIKELFSPMYDGEFTFIDSQKSHFRSRAEFRVYHDKGVAFFAMNSIDGKILPIKSCPKVDPKIASLFDPLLEQINSKDEIKSKLFGVEFITTKDEILLILLYHKDIGLIDSSLRELKACLNINLVARSRNKRAVYGSDLLKERLNIFSKEYYYRFGEGSFIQPNREVNEKMIGFVIKALEDKKTADLLELYCGHGNFTIPLSQRFDRVLATEISKKSIENARINCIVNGVKNTEFIRMSSYELIEAFEKKREFFRLKDIDLSSFNFSHILVDPPRAGLEKEVLDFIQRFESIIYISCNPLSLKENLIKLCKSHKIDKFELFDQFAYTRHIECGVLLSLK